MFKIRMVPNIYVLFYAYIVMLLIYPLDNDENYISWITDY